MLGLGKKVTYDIVTLHMPDHNLYAAIALAEDTLPNVEQNDFTVVQDGTNYFVYVIGNDELRLRHFMDTLSKSGTRFIPTRRRYLINRMPEGARHYS